MYNYRRLLIVLYVLLYVIHESLVIMDAGIIGPIHITKCTPYMSVNCLANLVLQYISIDSIIFVIRLRRSLSKKYILWTRENGTPLKYVLSFSPKWQEKRGYPIIIMLGEKGFTGSVISNNKALIFYFLYLLRATRSLLCRHDSPPKKMSPHGTHHKVRGVGSPVRSIIHGMYYVFNHSTELFVNAFLLIISTSHTAGIPA